MDVSTNPYCMEAFTWIPPFLPLLVVMITTPFAAREPYREVEAASLRMVKDSISSWLIVFSAPSYCTPSTINKGSVSPFNVPTPRITIPGEEPGPVAEVNCTPVARPSMAAIGEVTFLIESSSAPTTLAEPVKASLVLVP